MPERLIIAYLLIAMLIAAGAFLVLHLRHKKREERERLTRRYRPTTEQS